MQTSAQASWAPEPEAPPQSGSGQKRRERAVLGGLLEALVQRGADWPLLQEPASQDARRWSAGALHETVLRLAARLLRLRLPAEAMLGLCLPAGRESLVALLAAERAGFTPVLLPLTGKWPAVARQIEETGIQAVITTARLAGERPAERIAEIAARYFGLRFVMAFGAEVPDGVADLDRVLSRPAGSDSPVATGNGAAGLVSLTGGTARRAVFRPWRALVAASATILDAAQIQAGQRVVSLIAPDDLAGLATGPLPALLTGACLEAHPVFDGRALLAALGGAGTTHLVVPGWMEPLLRRLGLPETLASVILVHRAPTRLEGRALLARRVVDVLAFGETALVAAARRHGGLPALSLEAWPDSAVSDLLRCTLDAEGQILFAGPAACCGAVEGRRLPPAEILGGWQATGLRPEIFAGLIVGVS